MKSSQWSLRRGVPEIPSRPSISRLQGASLMGFRSPLNGYVALARNFEEGNQGSGLALKERSRVDAIALR